MRSPFKFIFVDRLMADTLTKTNNTYGSPRRLSFPSGEARIGWLSMLLDAYFESDRNIHETIAAQVAKKKRVLACTRGCSSCCNTHVTIPVYPLELLGLYWFVLEKAPDEHRQVIIAHLDAFEPGKGCPFLIRGICSVHPMRPMACRFFNVFSRPCKEGEDPYYTRRNDVMIPDEKGKNKALSLMLPYHGITDRAQRREAMRKGTIHQFAKNLQNINWPRVAVRLKQMDQTPLFKFTL